jgi:hypothetical protein
MGWLTPSGESSLETLILKELCTFRIRDSSVGIALDYRLDDRGGGVRFPAGAGSFSLFTTASRTALGPNPVSYPAGIRGYFPGGKVAGA